MNLRQEPVLFSGTIADNIRLGDETITDDAIHKACKVANAHDFIEKLAEVGNIDPDATRTTRIFRVMKPSSDQVQFSYPGARSNELQSQGRS